MPSCRWQVGLVTLTRTFGAFLRLAELALHDAGHLPAGEAEQGDLVHGREAYSQNAAKVLLRAVESFLSLADTPAQLCMHLGLVRSRSQFQFHGLEVLDALPFPAQLDLRSLLRQLAQNCHQFSRDHQRLIGLDRGCLQAVLHHVHAQLHFHLEGLTLALEDMSELNAEQASLESLPPLVSLVDQRHSLDNGAGNHGLQAEGHSHIHQAIWRRSHVSTGSPYVAIRQAGLIQDLEGLFQRTIRIVARETRANRRALVSASCPI
mmetsp:Transcript_73605/g.186655  ORF Transcript_73605/g.186655 Transcript_73605/m.186655 type:complete len:263 (-) Transcript_73605:377-1165(-)